MGRFTDRVAAGKKQQRLRSGGTTDGTRRPSSDKLPMERGGMIELGSDVASEVSIDERLSQLSREPSVAFSDADSISFTTRKSDGYPPFRTTSVLLERERTISALLHKIEEMQNSIDTLSAETVELKKENCSLRANVDSATRDAAELKAINASILEGQQTSQNGAQTQSDPLQTSSDASAQVTLQSASKQKEDPTMVVLKIELRADADQQASISSSSSADSTANDTPSQSASNSPRSLQKEQQRADKTDELMALSPKPEADSKDGGQTQWTTYVSTAVLSSVAVVCIAAAAVFRPRP